MKYSRIPSCIPIICACLLITCITPTSDNTSIVDDLNGTFPERKEQQQSLLLIPIAIITNDLQAKRIEYNIYLKNIRDPVVVNSFQKYCYVDYLIPGKYQISGYSNKEQSESRIPANFQFELSAGTITILPQMAYFGLYRDSRSDSINHTFRLAPLLFPQRESIAEEILSIPASSTWDSIDTGFEIIPIKVTSAAEMAAPEKPDTDLISEAELDIRTDLPWIAILDFNIENIPENEGVVIVDLLGSSLFKTNKFRVLERSQQKKILEEIEFSLGDCTDVACQLEVGKLLAAENIVVGSLALLAARYIVDVKLIRVETGETISVSSKVYKSLDSLLDNIDVIAAELSQDRK